MEGSSELKKGIENGNGKKEIRNRTAGERAKKEKEVEEKKVEREARWAERSGERQGERRGGVEREN